MAKRIVFVCGEYYPNFSATGNCIRQIAKKFVESGSYVTVISISPDGTESADSFEGVRILRVTSRRQRAFVHVRARSSYASTVGKLRVFAIKAFWAVRILMSRSGMDEDLVHSYVRKLEEILPEGIDAVLPCCMPVASVKASYEFCKKNGVLLFPILYDRYSENRDFFRFTWNHNLRKGYAKKIEENIFSFSTRIFYVDNWAEYFAAHLNPKAIRVEHPLVVKRDVQPRPLEGATEINAIYQGEINHQMRPPQAMLTAFESITRTDSAVTLHVFASGNGVADVIAASRRNPERIRFYGRVDKALADQYYDAANIQIILANRDKEIVSSKIFESVSSGYPCVYFYFSEEEKSFQLLKKYPLVFFQQQDQIDEDACIRLRNWMYEHKNQRVDFDVVREAYSDATPDLIVDETFKVIG